MTQVKKNENLKAVEPQQADNVLDFGETLRELRKNVDPSLVRRREGWRDRNGNVQMVDYVEWHTVADILDETAPNWAHTIKDMRQVGDIMTVTVAITIDGITREGIGTGSALNDIDFWAADGITNNDARQKFSLNTCNGCHGAETGTAFLHIAPREVGSAAALSGFLTQIELPDPVDPATTRSFNDLARRATDMVNVLCSATDAALVERSDDGLLSLGTTRVH